MNSRTYQLASEPNDTNADDEINYSHNRLRRLSAEQLLDSQTLATGAPLQLKDQPKITRISQVIEGRKHYKPLTSAEDKFLAAFGKPPRLVCSESERSNETTMGQAFQFVSGPLLNELLTRKEIAWAGWWRPARTNARCSRNYTGPRFRARRPRRNWTGLLPV